MAEGYRRLCREFQYTQGRIARALGTSRSHVANTLRLLNLPPTVQRMLRDGALSAGHARALVNADRPAALAAQIVTGRLSVRETERLVRRAEPVRRQSPGRRDSPVPGATAVTPPAPPGPSVLAERLSRARHEVDRLCGLVSAMRFSPLHNGVRSRADALYVLGFPPNSRPDPCAVKEKYRLLARIHHPDSGFGDHLRMCQLNQAAALLSARP
jgi:hypothetical protein